MKKKNFALISCVNCVNCFEIASIYKWKPFKKLSLEKIQNYKNYGEASSIGYNCVGNFFNGFIWKKGEHSSFSNPIYNCFV